MDFKFYGLCFANILLIATSCIYGVKFLKKGNYLLGYEWLIVTISASNALFYFLADAQFAYRVSYFLDAFSRSFGIPVISIAGLMVITHRYKPSIFTDVALFAFGIVVTVVVATADFMMQPKPYFYLVMWTVFSIYLAYFIKRLLNAGENFQAASLTMALISSQAIASIYDFYKLPGDDDHTLFYAFALATWAYLCVGMYYAYCALERAEENYGHAVHNSARSRAPQSRTSRRA